MSKSLTVREAIEAGMQKKKVDILLAKGGRIFHVFSVTRSVDLLMPDGNFVRVSPWGKVTREDKV